MPAPRPVPKPAPAPREDDEVDDEPHSRATFERAAMNPLVADSLRERTRDPLYIRLIGVIGALLVVGFFSFRLIQPYLPGGAADLAVISKGDGSLSVRGRTGDYVRVFNQQDEPVYQMSFPFGSIALAPGNYKVTVEGPGNEERPYVSEYVVIEPGKSTIFNAAKHAPVLATPEPGSDGGESTPRPRSR